MQAFSFKDSVNNLKTPLELSLAHQILNSNIHCLQNNHKISVFLKILAVEEETNNKYLLEEINNEINLSRIIESV